MSRIKKLIKKAKKFIQQNKFCNCKEPRFYSAFSICFDCDKQIELTQLKNLLSKQLEKDQKDFDEIDATFNDMYLEQQEEIKNICKIPKKIF